MAYYETGGILGDTRKQKLASQLSGGTAQGPLVVDEAPPPGLPPGTVSAAPAASGGLKPLPAGSALHQTGWLGDPSNVRDWVYANKDYISPGNSSPTPEAWVKYINDWGGFNEAAGHGPDYAFGRMTHTDKEYNDAIPHGDPAMRGLGGGMAAPMGAAQSGLNALLQGDATGNIQQALNAIGGGGGQSRIQQLIDALSKGAAV